MTVRQTIQTDTAIAHGGDPQQQQPAKQEVMIKSIPIPEQKVEIKSALAEFKLKNNETYFLISAKWFAKWKEYVNYNSEGDDQVTINPHPGPIDNSDLFIDSELTQLRSGLADKIDFITLEQSTWESLLEWYGGGPVISRPSFLFGLARNQLQVNIYPITIKYTIPKQANNATIMETGEAQFSKQSQIRHLLYYLCKLSNRAPHTGRLYKQVTKQNGESEYIFIDNLKRTIEEAGFVEGDAVIVKTAPPSLNPAKSPATPASEPNKDSRIIPFDTWGPPMIGTQAYAYSARDYEKSPTGFVGLSNQGATCYLNSLIQTMFMTHELRRLVYKWRYNRERDGPEERCIPLQLQRLFARLQLSQKRAATTTSLTKSFGWEGSEAFVQHDVQELCRVLFEALDKTLAKFAEEKSGTSSEQPQQEQGQEEEQHQSKTPVSDLFRGIISDEIEVVDGSHKQVRQDEFLDIQLVVRDVSSVYEALENFVKPEKLDGENQWFCEQLGRKVDAIKGLKFNKLPYLLTLQLKRFDYDYTTWRRIKLGNKVSFPIMDALDMTHFLPSGSDKHEDAPPARYELYSVLIHSGSATGGHYYAYIKNIADGKWYNFNDSNVSEITPQEVEAMYGEDAPSTNKSSSTYHHSTNAYMLMYRLIDPKRNLNYVSDEEISEEIRMEIARENELIQKEMAEWEAKNAVMDIRVVTHDNKMQFVKINKTDTINQALRTIAEAFGHQVTAENFDDMRLREYDYYAKEAGQVFDGTDREERLDKLGFHANKSLLFETRIPETGDFPVVKQKKINVQVVKLNPKTLEFEAPVTVQIVHHSNLESLKAALSAEFGQEEYPKERLRIIRQVFPAGEILEGDKRSLRELQIYENIKLYVEVVPENASPRSGSLAIKLLQDEHNRLELHFNFPDTDNYENVVITDKREPLRVLKEKIAEIINLDVSEFRFFRKYSAHMVGIELKDLSKPMSESYLQGCKIHVERGRAQKPTEHIVEFFLYNPIDPAKLAAASKAASPNLWKLRDSQFTGKFEMLVEETMPLIELKKILAEKTNIPVDLMRLYQKQHSKVKKILYSNNRTMRENYPGLADHEEIAIQQMDTPDNFKDGDMTLTVKRWHSSTWKFDSDQDIIINDTTENTVGALRKKLSEYFHIERVAIAKPPNGFSYWDKKETADIPLLNWKLDDSLKLFTIPMDLQEGSLVLFKDADEPEKVPLAELRQQKLQRTTPHQSGRPEVALKIKIFGDEKKENSSPSPSSSSSSSASSTTTTTATQQTQQQNTTATITGTGTGTGSNDESGNGAILAADTQQPPEHRRPAYVGGIGVSGSNVVIRYVEEDEDGFVNADIRDPMPDMEAMRLNSGDVMDAEDDLYYDRKRKRVYTGNGAGTDRTGHHQNSSSINDID